MSRIVRTLRGDGGRDTALLTAQLDVLSGIVEGVPLAEALDDLLRVVETVSGDGLLGSVLLLDPDGRHLRHCAAPSLLPSYSAAIDGIEIGPSVGSCGTAAYRREQVIVEDVTTDPLWTAFRDLASAAGVRACWSTPIVDGHGRVLGTFAMYYPQPHRPSGQDLALIDVLVRTVRMAIERSLADEERDRALQAERSAATTLQHSLLPDVPRQIGPVLLEARYRTGDPGVEVGGDWFDAVPVPDGLMLVVGDVQGHDLGAAALMGQLRTIVRAYAAEGLPPSGVLAAVSRYLTSLESELLATALVLHVDIEGNAVTAACAGHLPPLLLAPGGGRWQVHEVDVEVGPPLGIGESWPEVTTVLPLGGVLLLYTDGLVESRAWTLADGLRLLHKTVGDLPCESSLGDVLDAALEVIPSGLRGDDVAVLAARTPGAGERLEHAVRRWLPPTPVSAPLARSWTRGVLRGWSVPAELDDPVLLVVTELVSNAARHTDQALRVALSAAGGELTVEVWDAGHRVPELVEASPDRVSGRGLHVVAALAKAWGVREEAHGKTVWARLS